MMPRFAYPTVVLMAFGIVAYAVFVYGFLPLGQIVHPAMRESFQAHPALVYTHVFASCIALGLGALQFSTRLRARYLALHRWLGRCYFLLGVLPGGIAGLIMAKSAFGGLLSEFGFATLAILWLFTAVKAYIAIRQGRVLEHQAWMTRNYALTCAAITLRVYLPLSLAAGAFETAYPLIAWLCWVPNLLFAEWRIRQKPESNNS